MSHASPQFAKVMEELRGAYDRSASKRDEMPKTPWKLAERTAFLDRLQSEGKTRLLEVGAGTGHDALFFQQQGLSVVATDLSPEMVERCRAKGLEAHAMDFLHLEFPPASFDAVYALNCLLHVPNADLPAVLSAVRGVLSPGGIFFLGVYGGEPSEGIATNDVHDPPRFFSLRSDEQIEALARDHFEVLDFHVVEQPREAGSGKVARDIFRRPDAVFHFQSLTLRSA